MNPANHREQLIGMLTEAAEIEHCLMCTYIYGALSLKSQPDHALTDEELQRVRRWRGQVIRIATDEMLHLALVSNLLIGLGARPHYRRFNFPIAAGLFPADVAVELAPMDEATLDHFIYLERPRDAREHDGAHLHKAHYQRRAIANRLMPFSDDYTTVGELYEAIEASFEYLAGTLGEAVLFAGGTRGQLTRAEFALPGLCTIASVADAREAIHLIIHQGEGARESHDDSHYARFSAIRAEWQAMKAARPAFTPFRAAARNPVMRSPVSEDRVQVTAEPASTLLDAGNTCYGLMLRLLAVVSDDPAYVASLAGGRRAASQQTLLLMHALTEIGDALTCMPANAAFPGITAGLTFTVSRQALSFPSPIACAALLAESLQALGKRLEELDAVVPGLMRQAAAVGRIAQAWRKAHELLVAGKPESPPAGRSASEPQTSVFSKANGVQMNTVKTAAPPAAKVDVARGKVVTIRFDHSRCIHSRHCVLGEPAVFVANKPGEWIYPDAATPEHIAIVAHNCPSGAITYERNDGVEGEINPLVNVARLRENGPVAIHAELQIAGAADGSCTTRATLCRCGQSKNKPFCDGSHNDAKFIASGEPATQSSEALPVRNGPLAVRPLRDGPLEITGNLELCSGTGRTINRVADVTPIRLCRCGQSANKPYCDGTHGVVGFVADGV